MTAKRRTFRGRRRTLKGGDCCDYESFNTKLRYNERLKRAVGCGDLMPATGKRGQTQDPMYLNYDLGGRKHTDYVIQAGLKDENCIKKYVNAEIVINDVPGPDRILLNIELHALKHLDTFKDYGNICNKQYQFVTDLVRALRQDYAKRSILKQIYDGKDPIQYEIPEFGGEEKAVLIIFRRPSNRNGKYYAVNQVTNGFLGGFEVASFATRNKNDAYLKFDRETIASDIIKLNSNREIRESRANAKKVINEVIYRYGLPNTITSFKTDRGKFILRKMAKLYSRTFDCNNLTYRDLFKFIHNLGGTSLDIARAIYELDRTIPPITEPQQIPVNINNILPRPAINPPPSHLPPVPKTSSIGKSTVAVAPPRPPNLVAEISENDPIPAPMVVAQEIEATAVAENAAVAGAAAAAAGAAEAAFDILDADLGRSDDGDDEILKQMYRIVYERLYPREPELAVADSLVAEPAVADGLAAKAAVGSETAANSMTALSYASTTDSQGDPGGGAAAEDAGSIKQSVPTLETVYSKIKNTAKLPTLDDAEKKIIAENKDKIIKRLSKEKENKGSNDLSLGAHIDSLIVVKKSTDQRAAAKAKSLQQARDTQAKAAAKKKGGNGGKRITKKRKARHTTKTRRRTI
jgi:hypothetical protein